METAAPSPHGQFLAAVELGLAPEGAAGDSAEFRTLLHEQSAAHAAKSDPLILVPIRILRREIAITLGFSILVGACLLIRGHEFRVLCLRALAPTANLARVSNFQIRILEPAPVEGEFPEGEKLAVQVAITGPATVAPSLETFGGTSTGRTPMRPDGRGHFVAGIDLGKSPLQFRIQAGDALTRKFSLRPVARPHAVAFQKNYLPPAYSGLSSRNIREEDGHLTALEGTQVELEIQLDQAVRSASINLEREGRSQSLPLVPTKRADVFTCTLPVQRHATYHLELVGAATGFPSRTTPQFEIRPESDLAPTVSLETPVQDFALPLGEKIQIRGHAEDDLGLVSFTQAIRINQGAWTEVPLMSQPGKVCEAQRTWDALVDRAKPGDLLTTKLVATDSKGQRSESRSIQIAVALSGTISSASKTLALHREIHQLLKGLQRETQEASRALGEVKTQNESRSPDSLKRDQAMLSAQRALENAVQKAAATRALLAAALATPGDAQSEKDLRQTAQLLNRIQSGYLEAARDSLQESNAGASLRAEDKKEALRTAADAAAQASNKTNVTTEAFRSQLAVEEAISLKESARVLAEEQLALSTKSGEPERTSQADGPSPSQQRQQVNEAAVRTFQQDLAMLAEHSNVARDNLRPVREDLQKTRTALEKSMAAPDSIPENSNAARALATSLDRSGETLTNLHPNLEAAAAKGREAIQRETQSASQRLEQLQRELEALTQRPALSLQTRNAQTALRVAAEAATLQADATLESTLPESGVSMAPDLATAARALRAVGAESLDSKASATKAKALAEALRPLEGATKLEQAARSTESLAKAIPETPTALSQAQREAWKSLQTQLQKLPEAVKSAGLPETTAAKLREALDSDSAARIRTAIETAATPQAAPPDWEDAADLAANLQKTSRSTAAAVTAAREALNKQAPTVAEEFKRMAATAARAGEDTRKLASTSATASPAETAGSPDKSSPLADAQKEGNRLARQIAGARDALAQEANQQNLMTSEGREKARDADASAALLQEARKAADTLGEAAKAQEARAQSALLQKAAEEQSRLAKQLAQVAQHAKNMQNAQGADAARSRADLRESEKESGVAAELEAMQKRASDLASLASASPAEAKARLEAMTQASSAKIGKSSGSSPLEPDSSSNAAESQALQTALESLQAQPGGAQSLPAAAASALAAAAQANQAAARSERTQQSARNSPSTTAAGSSGNATALSGQAPGTGTLPSLENRTGGDWGKLPKQIASDLMEGRREQTSGEYQAAIESYFRTVAEKARQTRDNK
jgi:hypothetical protein